MKFGYCIFYVASVEKTLAFFEKAFGQQRRFLHESGMYGELVTGETTLAFAAHEMADLNFNGQHQRLDECVKPIGMEIAFVTSDVLSAYETAINAGAVSVAQPTTKPWGQMVGYVKTSDGILVEICSPMEG